jgi:transmembrane sensor
MRILQMERREKLALVSEEAGEWFIRLKDDGLAAAEQEEYLQWLKASPEHIAEALRIGHLFAGLRRVGIEGVPADENVSGEDLSNVVELPTSERAAAARTSEKSRNGWRSWPLAAALCAVAAGSLLVAATQFGWFNQAIETEASEWRQFTLEDGSVVRAGPRTHLNIQFDEKQRLIRLPDGEALFQVAKDKHRPFYVDTGVAVVRAVGTEFGVSRKEGKILVTVAEGLVSVSQQPSHSSWFKRDDNPTQKVGSQGTVAVAAGQQAAVPRAGPVTVQRVDVRTELAWAEGRLIFKSGTTVAEAIDEFNKRNLIQIAVDDKVIADQPVRGAFNANDPESFVQFLVMVVHISVVRDRPGVLFLQPVEEASDDSEKALPPISADAPPPDESPTGPSETRTSEAL